MNESESTAAVDPEPPRSVEDLHEAYCAALREAIVLTDPEHAVDADQRWRAGLGLGLPGSVPKIGPTWRVFPEPLA